MKEIKDKTNNILKNFWKLVFGGIIALIGQQTISSGKLTILYLFNISTYKNIGRDVLSSPYAYVFLSCISLMAFLFYASEIYRKVKLNNIITATINVFITILMCFMIYYNLTRYISVVTANDSYKNIEIIRPHISEEKYINLKSDLYQIDSKESLNKFNKEVRDIANKSHSKIY